MNVLKSASPEFRKALFKAGEHVCLTEPRECCRETAVKYRDYINGLTVSPNNRVADIDNTSMDVLNEQYQKYFKKRGNT